MKLLVQLAHKQHKALAFVILLSVVSAFLSIGVIAFIQYELLSQSKDLESAIWQFFGLLTLLLITATFAQVSLHKLGHRFVYARRCELVKQLINTDIEQIEQVGSAGVLASLNTDIRNITIAFVTLPDLIYGLVLSIVALTYLAFLSPLLFGVSLLTLGLTGVIGYLLVARITFHVRQVRDLEDRLYQDYQAIIDGRKELSLNPHRARRYFDDEFSPNAAGYRDQVTQADIYNGFASNMANTVVLGLIGLNFYLALGLDWASFEVASTFALIILFMRMPLMAAVGALPGLISANISMRKLESLDLSHHTSLTTLTSQASAFESLDLRNVTYQYRADGDDRPFCVGPLNFKVSRGELIFVIGGNGSGKSTFARLLTGLYRPHSGDIFLNDTAISEESWSGYRQQFSSVFSDFYLFHQIADGQGQDVQEECIDEWMDRLEMSHKVSHDNGRLSDVRYSQGQRKRLALLMAIAEKRGCILLDEWAADQDPRFRKVFYTQLLPLLKAREVTVIAITHDDRYFDAADRIFKMEAGQLTELNTCDHSYIQSAVAKVVL
ncbi:multidrug ABC transporter permease/ATP-binding protein [Vibrio ostreicida]|uniref:multidrug ABC transporter permease/ATP-binding protein n=1 Tax=Vibrio ostreicida TaxID=526588 RepID=UPI000970D379|nr:multidrug ABC transporter permease/ATP-binding protein [Vibrio ostreicida]